MAAELNSALAHYSLSNPLTSGIDGGGSRGPLLFTGTITPHDSTTGALVTRSDDLPEHAATTLEAARFGSNLLDIPVDMAVAQTWVLYSRLVDMLKECGSDLSRLVRQRLYLQDIRDLTAVERIIDAMLPSEKPATTITQMSPYGTDPRIRVVLEAVALQESSEWDREETYVDDHQAESGVTFPDAVRVGPFIFLGNTVGINKVSGRLAEVISEFDCPEHRWSARLENENQILAQSWATFANIADILRTYDADLSQIFKVNGWLDFMMRDYRPVAEVREVLFPDTGHLPASASVTIGGMAHHGALLGYEAIALHPAYRDHSKPSRSTIRSGMSPIYTDVIQADNYVFTCGNVPIDNAAKQVIVAPSQLDRSGRQLSFGRLTESRVEVQTWDVYSRHAESLAQCDVSFEDVIHQTVFMRNPSEYSALERVANQFLGPVIPPTSLVPILDTSPFLDADIEIELVAFNGAGPR